MITFGNKLNRRYSLFFPFMDTHGILDVYFHKNSSFLGINLENRFFQYIKEHKSWYHIYRDISKSQFCQTFLDIQNKTTEHLDIKNQFYDIQEHHKGKIQYLANETIKVSKVDIGGKSFTSFLYLYLFTIDSYEEEFVYLIAERQHIDIPLEKKIVRTCGVQVCTDQRLQELIKTYNFDNEQYNNTNTGKITLDQWEL